MSLQEQEGWKHQEMAYKQGLLAGYTKSIVLIRHIQRTLSPNANISPKRHQREILEQAMELIAENIETINNE